MADPIFVARMLAASLVAMVLILGAGNVNGTAMPSEHAAAQVFAGK